MPLDNLLPALQVGQLLATAYTAVFAIIGHVPSVAAPTIQYPLPDGHWGPLLSCVRSWEDLAPESDDVYRTSCGVGNQGSIWKMLSIRMMSHRGS
jgi:hypothetical protein